MVLLCGGNAVFVDCPLENNFKLKAEDLDRAITPKTKWLVLNSPRTPRARPTRADELKAITEVSSSTPTCGCSPTTCTSTSCSATSSSPTPRADRAEPDRPHAHMNGVSKAYAMTGWRIGYAAGPGQADQGHGHGAGPADLGGLLHRPVGGRRGAERPAGLQPDEPQGLRGAPRPRRVHAQPGQGPGRPRCPRAHSTSTPPAPMSSARRRPAAR